MAKSILESINQLKKEIGKGGVVNPKFTGRFYHKRIEHIGRVNASFTIKRAKGKLGGRKFESEAMVASATLAQSAKDLFSFKWNEKNHNLIHEVEGFISQFEGPETVLLEGDCLSLIRNYWDESGPKRSKYIKERDRLFDFLFTHECIDTTVDYSLYTNARKHQLIMDTMKSLERLDDTKDMVQYKLEHVKLVSEFESQAKLLMARDGLGGALAFSLVYRNVFQENSQMELDLENKIAVGKVSREDENVAERYTEYGEYRYTRMSSSFDLFAEGAVNFGLMLRDEHFVPKTKSVPTVLDFVVPKEKVQNVLSFLQTIVGQREIEIRKDGLIFSWKGLSVSQQNMALTKRELKASFPKTAFCQNDKEKARLLETYSKPTFMRQKVFIGNFDSFKATPCGFRHYATKKGTEQEENFVQVFFEDFSGFLSEATIEKWEKERAEKEALEAMMMIQHPAEDPNLFVGLEPEAMPMIYDGVVEENLLPYQPEEVFFAFSDETSVPLLPSNSALSIPEEEDKGMDFLNEIGPDFGLDYGLF